jgi:hypothetical protein
LKSRFQNIYYPIDLGHAELEGKRLTGKYYNDWVGGEEYITPGGR